VAKARLPLLSGTNADRTANLANVPWMFSLLPGQHLQAKALTDALAMHFKPNDRLIMISSTDHDSHIFSTELIKCFDRHQIALSYHYQIKPNQVIEESLLQQVIKAKSNAVVVAAALQDSVQLVRGLHKAGYEGLLAGGPCMSRQAFIDLVGEAAEGAVFPLLYEASPESAFEKGYRDRFGRQPNYLSIHTYDTVNLLIEAIHQAGLNRQAIRDRVEQLSPWQGATGTVTWDEQGSNTRSVQVGTITQGRIVRFKR
jgi:ABC-type branched-subunit amino acid transport system substrate-binding protein